ncbi:hypothetical protein [Streptomyces sp. NPDC057381]|uniref:hypothetical protein n=1 Tax=unclassified Streptomyces TaxID=2593676 RepID=UPI00363358A1
MDVDALGDSLRVAQDNKALSKQRIGGEESFDRAWLRAAVGRNRVCHRGHV